MSDWTRYYKDNPNNISNWYPKIKDCGLNVPKTIIFETPEEIMKAYFMDKQDDKFKVLDYVKEHIIPVLRENNAFFLFMKNGTFSNKFDFNASCKVRAEELDITSNLININYSAEMLGAAGLSEIAIREFIGDWNYIDKNIPTIYNGMPLRPESRTFYDFDKHKVLYSVNYWDWDYCYESISRNITDKMIYEDTYEYINGMYLNHKDQTEELISEHMKNVELTGIWSIDMLWDEQYNKFWLIDMATAETSAYWKGENE